MRRLLPLLHIAFICSLFIYGCSGNVNYRQNNGVVWNTTYNVIYSSNVDLGDTVRAAMRKVELSLSPFNKESVISRINRNETEKVDSFITIVFNASKEINRQSEGAFDPTLAPLINLYGFGYKSGSTIVPTKTQTDSVLELVGIDQCAINNGVMSKKHPETEFNFSAITKGFGVDEVARALERNGVENYLVEIGGEVRVAGKNPDGKLWRVQIDAPNENNSGISHNQLTVEELTDISVATSGNYRNFKKTGKGKIGHTISPKTGQPVAGKYLSVTVYAPECMVADGWATAIMAGAPIENLPEGIRVLTVEQSGDSLLITRH